MKIRQLIKGFGGALVAAVLIFSASANADPVTQLIHFDDATNGWKWYSDVDNNFLFDPTTLQSGNCADSTNGGNGSCVIEQTQDNLPLMTRREFGPYSQGQSGNNDPDVSGEYWPFTLDSFYFFLTGKGSQGENALTITGGYGTPQTGSTVSKTFLLGSTYSEITYYDDEVGNPGDPAGALAHNIAYIASFGDFFADVTWIKWNSASSACSRGSSV